MVAAQPSHGPCSRGCSRDVPKGYFHVPNVNPPETQEGWDEMKPGDSIPERWMCPPCWLLLPKNPEELASRKAAAAAAMEDDDW